MIVPSVCGKFWTELFFIRILRWVEAEAEGSREMEDELHYVVLDMGGGPGVAPAAVDGFFLSPRETLIIYGRL